MVEIINHLMEIQKMENKKIKISFSQEEILQLKVALGDAEKLNKEMGFNMIAEQMAKLYEKISYLSEEVN